MKHTISTNTGQVKLNSEFGKKIYDCIIENNYKKILDIGSWDGDGSTFCIVSALEEIKGDDRLLDCVEVNSDKFKILNDRYSELDYVQCHNKGSVSYKNFLPKDFIRDVVESKFNHIPSHIPVSQYEQWYLLEKEISKSIDKGAVENDVHYDMCIIDGGEFCGYSEYVLLKDRTKCMVIDDCYHAYKCRQAYEELKEDNKWILYWENLENRNGSAIFLKGR